jgi:two-component system cell cycle response regulator DivK
MIDWHDVKSWLVLLVDDEPDNLEVVAETLEFRGAQVRTALNGLEALIVLESFMPNLIIADLSMPQMDGWELKKRVKSHEKFQAIPLLALSAHAMIGDKERAITAGFDGYITKPVNIHTILEDIRAAAQETSKEADKQAEHAETVPNSSNL